jgi:hypothetical protein
MTEGGVRAHPQQRRPEFRLPGGHAGERGVDPPLDVPPAAGTHLIPYALGVYPRIDGLSHGENAALTFEKSQALNRQFDRHDNSVSARQSSLKRHLESVDSQSGMSVPCG